MIFSPALAEAIYRREKTVTRRAVSANPRSPWYEQQCGLRVGHSYAVQTGRGKHAIGRIRVTEVRLIELGHPDHAEALREGFRGVGGFRRYWKKLHKRYDPSQLVWRVTFEPFIAPAGGLERPVPALGWDLRTLMVQSTPVRLVLSERCDAVLPNSEGQRVVQGKVSAVSPTDAFAIVGGLHVPLDEIAAVRATHHTQALPSTTVYDLGN